MLTAKLLSKIFKKGGIILIDNSGQKFICGQPDLNKPLIIKFLKKNLNLKLLINPDLSFPEAYMKGDDVYGRIEILDTPSGKIIQSLIESGVTLGISSRGVGSTRADGQNQIVQDDFQLICWDFVSEPSTPGAFMMAEGREISKRDLDSHFTKSDRLDRLFNEVMLWEEE